MRSGSFRQTPGQRTDLAVDGGREQQRLARSRRRGDDRLDVVDEAHVEHAVGFVEHEHRQVRQVDAAALQVVEQTARRRDEDFGVLREQHQLLAVRDAAKNADRAQTAQVLAVRGRGGRDLHREFARRREHEQARARDGLLAARRAAVRVTRFARLRCLQLFELREALDGGQHERRGLARTGRAGNEEVASGERCGNRALLHGRRDLIAGGRQGGNDVGGQAERFEARAFGNCGRCLNCGRGRCCGGIGAECLCCDGVQRALGIARSHVDP